MSVLRGITESDGDQRSSSATSRSLLARLQMDEPAAWDRLVKLYAPLVFRWCRNSGLRDADIADIFQNVFQAVLLNIGTFRKDREGDTFRGWIRRITQNKLRDHFRKLGKEAQGVGGSSAQNRLGQIPSPQPQPQDLFPNEEGEQGLFARALDFIRGDFEERTWLAFWRTTVEGRPSIEVGEDLGMTPGAVRVAKSRVLRRLREELGDLKE
jgi:RNA polymerase sigma-70 factor (ECF subfamily)